MQRQNKPTFSKDGTVQVPEFELPPSELSSPEARAAQALRATTPVGLPLANADIHSARAGLEAMLEPQVIKMREVYPVDIAEQAVGGIATRVLTPLLARFPPTLIITGTRAMDMSPAVYTNSQLLKAGVRSTLIVGEGMGHCHIYQPLLPEARDAHQIIVNFFREHLN